MAAEAGFLCVRDGAAVFLAELFVPVVCVTTFFFTVVLVAGFFVAAFFVPGFCVGATFFGEPFFTDIFFDGPFAAVWAGTGLEAPDLAPRVPGLLVFRDVVRGGR